MNILINCCPLLSGQGGAGGAGSYLHGLLAKLPLWATVRVLAGAENRHLLEGHAGCQVVTRAANHYDYLGDDLAWADVYFSPLNGLTPEFLSCRIPIAVTLLDLQHAAMPHFFAPEVIALRHRAYGLAAARADAVITISEFERRNIRAMYGKQAVHVTYLSGYLADAAAEAEDGAAPSAETAGRLGWLGEREVLLYPAIPWPHKNHVRLIQAFHRLRQRSAGGRGLQLVLTGGRDHPLVKRNFLDLIEQLRLHSAVTHAGFLADRDLAWLFRQARLLVFPSLYEGFGIPVVDAMKFGTPVIAARAAAVPEVGGDAVAWFRDPLDARAMAEDLADLLGDRGRLAELAERGRAQGARFTAEATARQTLDCFRQAIAARQDGRPPEIVTIPDAQTLRPRRKLALLVDGVGGVAEAGEEALAAWLARFHEHTRPYRDTLQIVGLFAEDAPAEAVRAWRESGAGAVFIDADGAPDPGLAARFVRQEMVESDYLLFVQLGRFDPAVYGEAGYACALLDNQPGIDTVVLDDAGGRLFVRPPPAGAELIAAYDRARGDPAAYFHNRIIRLRSKAAEGFLANSGILDEMKDPAVLHLPIA